MLLPVPQQAQPQDCDLWDPPDSKSDSDALYLLAARRGPQFIDVAFKLLEFLEYLERKFNYPHHKESSLIVIQLICEETYDDRTVSVYTVIKVCVTVLIL